LRIRGFIDFGDERVVVQDMSDDSVHASFLLESSASRITEIRLSGVPR
jgi:hypothetical protein